jgi:hypothetical protein
VLTISGLARVGIHAVFTGVQPVKASEINGKNLTGVCVSL